MPFINNTTRPLIMGVLNVTPDSFSDGGKYFESQKAVERAWQMIEEGADIIDIGGESSGPGSEAVSLEEELHRVLPVLQKLQSELRRNKIKSENNLDAKSDENFSANPKISIDTYKAEVAETAIAEGADIINDVTALRGDPKMAQVLAKTSVPFIIMYSKDSTARTTREAVEYDDVIATIHNFFEGRLAYIAAAGIRRERCILDPGMGAFVSANPKYSLEILKYLEKFRDFGLPLLIGASRKSFIGQTLGLGLHERLEGSLACAAVAVMNGASIIRTHDVLQTRRVVDMVCAIRES